MIRARGTSTLPITLWVWFCALLGAAGWILSALRALNAVGYSLVLVLIFAGFAIYPRRHRPGWRSRKLLWRFRHLFPAGFAIVAGLAILGGVLHPPSNYDALAYRVPRVLHWLAAEQWHWIVTEFQRLNTRAPGFEWVAAPLTAILRTDRCWFLINVASLLLLPGLVFSLYTRLGVNRRVAWRWMWLLPTGYSFVLQAGGIGNDIFGAVFALAAVDFALRARATGHFADAATSCLGVALLTASKTSNLPLALPWALAILPCWRLFAKKPFATAGVIAIALLSSFLPTAVMNQRYSADWTGAHAEHMYPERYEARVTVPGNLMALTVQNFAPPVFPLASQWNRFAPHLMTEEFHGRMLAHFEPSAANLVAAELQNEEFSGLGFGLSSLVVASLAAGCCARRFGKTPEPLRSTKWVRWSPWISAAVYIAKTAIGTTARIFTPYYLLLLPALLTGDGQRTIVRRKWWRVFGLVVFVLAATVVVLTPSRPLWPAKTTLSALARHYPDNPAITRALTVFSVYAERADALAALRRALPPDQKVIGLMTGDDPETSLWRPFGSRRFLHVLRGESREQLSARGIRCVAVKVEHLDGAENFERWLRQVGGSVERRVSMRYRAARDPIEWCVVRLAE